MAPASGLAYMANPMLLDPTLQAAVEYDLSCVVAPARRAGLRAEGELREASLRPRSCAWRRSCPPTSS
jgi:hypothetical protein